MLLLRSLFGCATIRRSSFIRTPSMSGMAIASLFVGAPFAFARNHFTEKSKMRALAAPPAAAPGSE